MQRRNFKGFFAGMLTMLLIVAMVGSASATTGKVTKEIEYRNIAVSLDGTNLALKDAKGNAVEPFMFNGTNYIPARALAEALGLSVSWDGSTNTVVLKSSKDSGSESGSESSSTSSAAKDGLITDNSGIKIYYQGISKEKSYVDCYVINLKIVNESNKDITVQNRDLSINGIMSSSVFSCNVASGKTAVDGIKIYKSDLDKNGITSIDTASFKFHVFDSKTWDTVFDTAELTVNK